jgi:hypothetical protein
MHGSCGMDKSFIKLIDVYAYIADATFFEGAKWLKLFAISGITPEAGQA